MKTKRVVWYAVLTGTLLLSSVFAPARAQEQPPKVGGRIYINGPDGFQTFELGPDDLPPLGEGGQIMMMRVGPDGQIAIGIPGILSGNGLSVLGPNGAMFGGAGMGMGGLNIIDPARSYLHQLVQRHEVRTELFLNSKQCEQLDDLETNQQQAQQQQMRAMQEAMKDLGADLEGKTPDEIRDLMKERIQKTRDAIQNAVNERDKQLASILSAKQMTRLKELDLQWRGPLALGVKPVADQAKLTDEQFPKMTGLLQEYRKEISDQLGMGGPRLTVAQKQGKGADTGPSHSEVAPPPPPPASPEEMQDRLEKTQKGIDKAWKTLGEKALKELTDAQRQQWNTLTGRKFTFSNF